MGDKLLCSPLSLNICRVTFSLWIHAAWVVFLVLYRWENELILITMLLCKALKCMPLKKTKVIHFISRLIRDIMLASSDSDGLLCSYSSWINLQYFFSPCILSSWANVGFNSIVSLYDLVWVFDLIDFNCKWPGNLRE